MATLDKHETMMITQPGKFNLHTSCTSIVHLMVSSRVAPRRSSSLYAGITMLSDLVARSKSEGGVGCAMRQGKHVSIQ